MTAFAKTRVSGAGAQDYLNRLVANRLPTRDGRIGLCHALNTRGGVHSEFTIQRESANSFYLVSAGALKRLDQDWLHKQAPRDGSVRIDDLTSAMGVLVLAGPKARVLLQTICGANLANDNFSWLTGQETTIGLAPVKLLRINFVGEQGYEIHHGIEYQNHIFDALMGAGAPYFIKPFGIRAMDSMRLEKSYRMPGTELSIEYSAYESGLDRFIRPEKGDFIGRQALLEWQKRGVRNAFVTLEVSNHGDADPLGNNPLMIDGALVGRTTSGGHGFRLGKTLALAMVQPTLSAIGTSFEMTLLDSSCQATVIHESPYDPQNARIRDQE